MMQTKEYIEMCEVVGAELTRYESVCDNCFHPMCMPNTSKEDCDPDNSYPKYLYPPESADIREKLEELVFNCGGFIPKKEDDNYYYMYMLGVKLLATDDYPTRPQALYKLCTKLVEEGVLDEADVRKVVEG